MGNLRPIGSEKLQGMDKINRILQISRYNEHITSPVNENKSLEYQKILSDGNTYVIVKESNGYIIKKGLNEAIVDYMEPMKGRKYFSRVFKLHQSFPSPMQLPQFDLHLYQV